MAKSDKEKKITGKTNAAAKAPAKKEFPKPQKRDEEEEEDGIEGDADEPITNRKAGKVVTSSKKKNDDDDDDDEVEKEDDWEKVEEEENWDPDFAEFDVPKSKGKKTGGKKGVEEEEDFKIDDEFKDMFNDSDEFADDDDDY